MTKPKSPNAGKEIGRFTTGVPVTMEQVTREYAKIMAPVFLELIAKDREAEALVASVSAPETIGKQLRVFSQSSG